MSVLIPGCGLLRKKPPATLPSSIPPPVVESSRTPIAAPAPVNLPVKEGTPPLVYIVEADAMVRVVDMTDGVELLRMPVMARQIVSLDPEVGIRVGGATMKMMRLPTDRRYGIYVSSATENVTRTERVRPGAYTPAGVPGRQP